MAQWTWDQLLSVTMHRRDLQQSGGKIVRMDAREAYGRGLIKRDKRGSLSTLIKKGLIEVPANMLNTRLHFGPLPHEIAAEKAAAEN